MGRKQSNARQYFYICLTSLIFISFLGCASLARTGKEASAYEQLVNGKELLSEGDYKGSLREYQKVLSKFSDRSPGDEALFNVGLIYAHYGNPQKDYKKSIDFFRRLVKEFPRSPFIEEAKIWIGILEVIEKSKQADIEIEEKKKELTQ